MSKQNGKWNSTVFMSPTQERKPEYESENFVKSLLLQFPYGHSSLSDDKAVISMSKVERKKRYMTRNKITVLKDLLRNQKPEMQLPEFQLIINNIIMKDNVFQKSRILASTRKSEGKRMAELYSTMSISQVQGAVTDIRQNNSRQYSSNVGSRFFSSIRAVCASLPHSNEASLEARRTYFSFLIHEQQ